MTLSYVPVFILSLSLCPGWYLVLLQNTILWMLRSIREEFSTLLVACLATKGGGSGGYPRYLPIVCQPGVGLDQFIGVVRLAPH